MNLDWIVGIVVVLGLIVTVRGFAQQQMVKSRKYKCPKCGGSDYFMSNRNVMKGIGGIYGNRGGVKKFPVCKVCEEIMDTIGTKIMSKRTKLIVVLPILIGIALVLVPIATVSLIGVLMVWSGLIIGLVSLFIDYRNTR